MAEAGIVGKTASVRFAGLTSPALDLIRITIPSDLAPGPQPIQVSVRGSQTRSSLVLMLQ